MGAQMPVNRNALIRYRTIDKCLQNRRRKWTIENLIEACSEALYEFSPNAGELLNELLPRAVKISLFQAVIDAIVSENVMRMIAMKAATDNASGIAKSLHRSYNRARQGRITTELTEIISGAAALE